MTNGGTYFGVDPETESVTVQKATNATGGTIKEHDGLLYVSTAEKLLEIDPTPDTITVLLDNLDQAFYDTYQLTIDESNDDVYVLDGYDLLRVSLGS